VSKIIVTFVLTCCHQKLLQLTHVLIFSWSHFLLPYDTQAVAVYQLNNVGEKSQYSNSFDISDFRSNFLYIYIYIYIYIYEGRTESHEQLFFACELGTADKGEYGGRWNQLLCYP